MKPYRHKNMKRLASWLGRFDGKTIKKRLLCLQKSFICRIAMACFLKRKRNFNVSYTTLEKMPWPQFKCLCNAEGHKPLFKERRGFFDDPDECLRMNPAVMS